MLTATIKDALEIMGYGITEELELIKFEMLRIHRGKRIQNTANRSNLKT
jgi:hypothetical protein